MAGTLEGHNAMLRAQLYDQGKALEEETRQKTALQSANDKLKAENQSVMSHNDQLGKHSKSCEKAVAKAQKDAKHTKGHAEHLVKSQSGQLKSAERRAEESAKALQEWRDKYGWAVEKPAAEKNALQKRLSEWQSKAEKATNQIAALEQQIQGSPGQVGLHQALEEWHEHQSCSVEFMNLEDKIHDGEMLKQKLETDLTNIKERYQEAKSDVQTLQTRADHLEQVNKVLQEGGHLLPEQVAQAERSYQELKSQKDQLEQANKVLQENQITPQKKEELELAYSNLRSENDQLRQANKELQENQLTPQVMEDMGNAIEIVERELANKAYQSEKNQLEQANKTLQEQYKNIGNVARKLASEVKTSKEQVEETESNMKALEGKAKQLESDLKNAQEEHHTTKSQMDVLQGNAEQLKSDLETAQADLKNAQEEHQTAKSQMDVLEGKAKQLESDLKNAQEEHQTTKSQTDVLQGNAEQLKSDLEIAQADLKTAQEEHQTIKSQLNVFKGKAEQSGSDLVAVRKQHKTTKLDMVALRVKADQLEQANEALKKKERKNQLTQTLEKKGQDDEGDTGMAKAVPRDITNSMTQSETSEKPEHDIKTQQLRIERPKEAEGSQATPPASPTFTTDEGSLDLEKTPRPKKSLRQDLGYSSRDQSDDEQMGAWMPPEQGAMMPEQAETGAEKKEVGAEFWETNNSGDAEKPTKGSMRGEMKKLLAKERRAMNREANEHRAKEQSEVLETIFECTPAKANTIDRRLKALGPGCRLYEAPALVAFELSGIPEETYKGLASGQLIATMPPSEVRDVGTNTDVFAHDIATDTSGLPTNEHDMATDTSDLPGNQLTGTHHIATDTSDLPTNQVTGVHDVATDTSDLPTNQTGPDTTDLHVEEVTNPHTRFSRWTLFYHLLMLLMMLLGLFCLYMKLQSDTKSKTQHGLLYKNVYSHRYTPLPTPSVYAPTPIKFVNPPMPAPQLGLARMMKGSGGGRKW